MYASKKRNGAVAGALLAATLALPACHRAQQFTAEFSDKRDAFSQVVANFSNGSSRAEVLSLMGSPATSQVTALGGLGEGEVMRFVDATSKYHIGFYNQRAVFKYAASITSTTTKEQP